jgi:hypothetical protein
MTRFTTAQKTSKKSRHDTGKTNRVKNAQQVEEKKKEEFLGLCMTCIHADGCAFRRDVSQAVLECDEFDVGQTSAISFDMPSVSESRDDGSVKFKGLCVNCDVRHECKLPRPEEGVWHCEEYV